MILIKKKKLKIKNFVLEHLPNIGTQTHTYEQLKLREIESD